LRLTVFERGNNKKYGNGQLWPNSHHSNSPRHPFDERQDTSLGTYVGTSNFKASSNVTCKLIPDSYVLNCIIIAILSISVSLPFMFLGKAPLDWLAIGYHVLQLVMAIVVGLCWPRNAYH